jgi:hypothetical protein
MVLPRHHYLFTSRTLEQRLMTSYDTIHAWIRSVTEALEVVKFHDAYFREVSTEYFTQLGQQHPSSDSSYSVFINGTSTTSTTYATTSNSTDFGDDDISASDSTDLSSEETSTVSQPSINWDLLSI